MVRPGTLQPDGRPSVGCYLDGRGMVARDMDILLRSAVGSYGLPTVEDTAAMLGSSGLVIGRLDRCRYAAPTCAYRS